MPATKESGGRVIQAEATAHAAVWKWSKEAAAAGMVGPGGCRKEGRFLRVMGVWELPWFTKTMGSCKEHHWTAQRAATPFDEGRKQKPQAWIPPGSRDAAASPPLGPGVSGARRRTRLLSGRCATSRLAASSDSSPGFRMDQVTPGHGVNGGR